MRPWQIAALILCCGAILVFSVSVLRSDTSDVATQTKVVERILVQKEIAVKGKDGLRGGRGPIGKRGPRGRPGKRGPKGERGDMGARGPRGHTGLRGPDGKPLTLADLEKYCAAHVCRGPIGEPGKDGADGKDGRDGIDGAPGPAGPPGPAVALIPCAMQPPEYGYVCVPPPVVIP